VRDIPRTHVLTLRWIMRDPKPGEVSGDIELPVTTKVKDAVPVVATTSGSVRVVDSGKQVGVVDRVTVLQAMADTPGETGDGR
jgi:glycine betaine/proline transport system ATP-binding protein